MIILQSIFDSFLNSDFPLIFFHHIAVFLLNIISYAYIAVKFFKVICYSKLTFEWLPMINPYIWPFSFFQVLSTPYFQMWSKILPPVKFEKSSVEISALIALEALNSIIYFLVKFTNILVAFLQEIESAMQIL
uniref:Photosystem I assembly protein Ycf19 n=1 Tax=Mallomonas splendens TaxID=52552 RepID=A0A3G2QZU1_9STRA|nr:photosystem I assembly protein Ycf19 [Mallomonas splendens]AYO28519.1 photosystem I assembly protein Ycf19 [Mallomonas splendens]